jgi:hypothetical protein
MAAGSGDRGQGLGLRERQVRAARRAERYHGRLRGQHQGCYMRLDLSGPLSRKY